MDKKDSIFSFCNFCSTLIWMNLKGCLRIGSIVLGDLVIRVFHLSFFGNVLQVEFLICLILTILGYVPGIIYALYAILCIQSEPHYHHYHSLA